MTFDITTAYARYEGCTLTSAAYANNGHIYIGIENEEGPIANLTVNISGIEAYPQDCGAVDTNNFPEAVELIARLGIGTLVGYGASGFCTYPIYRFDTEAVARYVA